MRKQVNIGTYQKVKEVFSENPKSSYTSTIIRDLLKCDYYSVKLVIEILIKEKFIKETKGKYKLKRGKLW